MTPPLLSPAARNPSTRPYPKTLGSVLIAIGLLLGMAWAFRAWTIVLLAPGDTAVISHSVVALVSLGSAVMLCLIGWRTACRQPHQNDPSWLTVNGFWIAGVGVHRLAAVLPHPSTDPNPRAHLHLSVLFMVIGALLLGVAWFWKWSGVYHSNTDRTPV